MMKNANLPAMPQNVSINDAGDAETSERAGGAGLTKREMFAMHIMANTCWGTTDRNQPQYYQYAAESAVSLADAILAELEK